LHSPEKAAATACTAVQSAAPLFLAGDRQDFRLLRQRTIRNQKIREVVMVTTGIDNCPPYGMACTECNALLVAPKWSAYVSKRKVRHFWSCENCGHEIEMTVNPRINSHFHPERRCQRAGDEPDR
jgi:uncharacterized protein with PIN domain